MNEDRPQVGFNRYLKLEWLDYAASLMLAGMPVAQIKLALEDLLKDQLSVGSQAVRGSRGKTVSMLLSIWVTAPKSLLWLRDSALEQMRRLPAAEHLPFHWGMSMTVYPFFGMAAESAGRALHLQGSVSVGLLKTRLCEQYGQRETVLRSTRYTLQCFSSWGLLHEVKEQSGVYDLSARHVLQEARIAAWLLAAALTSSGVQMAALKSLAQSPRLFPFQIEAGRHLIEEGGPLEYFRQGLDEEMVTVKSK